MGMLAKVKGKFALPNLKCEAGRARTDDDQIMSLGL